MSDKASTSAQRTAKTEGKKPATQKPKQKVRSSFRIEVLVDYNDASTAHIPEFGIVIPPARPVTLRLTEGQGSTLGCSVRIHHVRTTVDGASKVVESVTVGEQVVVPKGPVGSSLGAFLAKHFNPDVAVTSKDGEKRKSAKKVELVHKKIAKDGTISATETEKLSLALYTSAKQDSEPEGKHAVHRLTFSVASATEGPAKGKKKKASKKGKGKAKEQKTGDAKKEVKTTTAKAQLERTDVVATDEVTDAGAEDKKKKKKKTKKTKKAEVTKETPVQVAVEPVAEVPKKTSSKIAEDAIKGTSIRNFYF
jgi:hypothetical protein